MGASGSGGSGGTGVDAGMHDSGMSGGGAGGSGSGGSSGSGGASGHTSEGCGTASELIGWASEMGNGVMTTTGGAGGPTMQVADASGLSTAIKGDNAVVIEIRGMIDGSFSIGSNKTLIGCDGGTVRGHIGLNKSQNVIIRNLNVVGFNCTDNPSDCSGGDDAITVQGASHHLWFDHDDVSDGSDGNLDMTHATDYVTIS